MRNNAYFALALAFGLAMILFMAPEAAFAQESGSGIFNTLQQKSSSTFSNVRIIMFIIAGFGIIGMAAMAFFGKFDWRWSFSMAGGLIILAAAGGIIYYATNSGANTQNLNNTGAPFSDTLN